MSDGTSDLRPCLILMGDHKLSTLARDYEAANVWLEFWCSENDADRRSAIFLWNGDAVAQGWDGEAWQ